MVLVKSKILEQLANNFPNFLKRDLSNLVEIILFEMENSLKKNERVELRDIFTFETRVQKARISRNPKTNEKVKVPEKKTIHFKMSNFELKHLFNLFFPSFNILILPFLISVLSPPEVKVPEKKTIHFKMSKKWFNKLNNE